MATNFMHKLVTFLGLSILSAVLQLGAGEKTPNIVVIWGDDIGQSNLSIYSKGVMGYHTPNIEYRQNCK